MVTSLFRRIQPAQRFHLTPRYIAHILRIPLSAIARIERWAYVLFVHRRDKGGQFISYRQLNRWMRTIAHMIQTSPTLEDLKQLGFWLKQESKKFEDRYSPNGLNYLRQLWAQRRDKLRSLPEVGDVTQ
ncbi:MAG TPA: hypothetical protein V6D37_14400 [Candidatus Sericytochromatia bacterium]|jgi:hypothetical protein